MSESTTANSDILLSSTKLQDYIGVWLDEKCNEEDYVPTKTALCEIFKSFAVFTDYVLCTTYINQHRPGKIFFIVSHEIGKNLIPLMLRRRTLPVEHIYIYCTNRADETYWNSVKTVEVRGGFTTVEMLIQEINDDILKFDTKKEETMPPTTSSISLPATKEASSNESMNHCSCYFVPPTSLFDRKMKNTSLKDLNKDSVWFIHFYLVIEILIRLEKTEQAKIDIIEICRAVYRDNETEQDKISRFEKEVENISRAIYWYTAESFLVHLLNKVCGTENVHDLYRFRLFISNLHTRIDELNDDRLTIQLKKKKAILYRGKRMDASTFENFRKSVDGLVAVKGFLSTTTDKEVAEMFAGAGVPQAGSVCVLFKFNIDNWEKYKSSAAIRREDSAIKCEQEVLFSIGSIWKIISVADQSKAGIWSIELASYQGEDAHNNELTNYLKEQLGETCSLWTLGDFLMKLGHYDKAEQYYMILENSFNRPENHADRAIIYNRLGLIRREKAELQLAIEYFEKAVKEALPDSSIKATAEYNRTEAQNDLKRAPVIFLEKRLMSSDVISKSLAANAITEPILENNLGYAAYHKRDYVVAIRHYEKAISIMMESKLVYLLEISCVYNNIGAVEYDKENYDVAKNYFEKAIFTVQQLNMKHPWIEDYKYNLAYVHRNTDKNTKRKRHE